MGGNNNPILHTMILQAIETEYIPATNRRGERIKATCARGSATIPYPYEGRNTDAHRLAAEHLIQIFCEEDLKQNKTNPKQNPWNFGFTSGQLANGNYVHVLNSGFAF
jgi:hypothetical protein